MYVTYAWTGTSGSWNDATHWIEVDSSLNVVPDGADASVVIDAAAPDPYSVWIQAGETYTVGAIALNSVVNQNNPWARLQIDGMLVFGESSDGNLSNALWGFTIINGGTVVNAGTLQGVIQTDGTATLLGTNTAYIANELVAADGTVTVDTTSIGNVSGDILDAGTIRTTPGSVIRLGGTQGNLQVGIGTIAADPMVLNGTADLIWDGPLSGIQQWDGAQYVGIEQTLQDIGQGGTLEILDGYDFETPNTLNVDLGGIVSLQGSTLGAAGGLNLNGGIFQGSGTIVGNVANGGTIGIAGGALSISGTLDGTGLVHLDYDARSSSSIPISSLLEVYAVSAGQTIDMNGRDVLVLDSPGDFLGSVSATVGDMFILPGHTVTGAMISGGSLVITGESGTLAALTLLGDYSNEHLDVNGSAVTLAAGPPPETTYTWIQTFSGDWNDPANWQLSIGGSGTPNGSNADVVIGLGATGAYTVGIGSDQNVIVNTLTLNPPNGSGQAWADMVIQGTLTFADGSSGEIAGAQDSGINLFGGTIVNVGTINAPVYAIGDVLLTGTNAFHLATSLDAEWGAVTIDTRSDDQISGSILTGGTYQVGGDFGIIRFGGSMQGMIVNIETIEGSLLDTTQSARLIWNSPGASILEWSASGYVGVQDTLKEIGARGTVDILAGLSFGSANILTIDAGGLLNLQANIVASQGIQINGGTLQGSASILSNVVNNGLLTSEGGTLYLASGLTGTGQVSFDLDQETLFTNDVGATLELAGAVSAGQTITMNGDDVLRLDAPGAFAGTIAAQVGDTFVLSGINGTAAVLSGSDLIVSDGSSVVATLHMMGDYSSAHFVANGSTITVEDGAPIIPALPYAWLSGTSGNWNTPGNWLAPGTSDAPNSAVADVMIDATPVSGAYTVQIGAGGTVIVNTLTLNASDTNQAGTWSQPYNAAALEIDGTLQFADGSVGVLDGAPKSRIMMNGGTIVNAGIINGLISTQGSVLFTGTNSFDAPYWLQASSGTVKIDTAGIARLSDTTLLGGVYQAMQGAEIDLGGASNGLAVNITRIEGSALAPNSPTQLILSGDGAKIREWNGSTLVSIESTLQRIGNYATLSVLQGRDYITANTIALDGGLLNLQAHTVTVGSLSINSGTVQGFATINGNVENDSTIVAFGGTLDLQGTLTGTGRIRFDIDQTQTFLPSGLVGSYPFVGAATLELHAASVGQSVVMNGRGDTLVLDAPMQFLGTIAAGLGDHIVLAGHTVTGAVVKNGSLVVTGAGGTLATLRLSGDYSSEHFVINGSTVTVAEGVAQPPSTGQLLFQNRDGSVAAWQMNGTTVSSFGPVTQNPGSGWYLRGTGLFYAGDTADYVWQNASGQVAIWQVQGTTVISGGVLGSNPGTNWHVKGTGDFYHSGYSAILWQNDNGQIALWDMNGTSVNRFDTLSSPGTGWHAMVGGDFYGDGNTDIIWQNDNGQVAIWDMNGSSVSHWGQVAGNAGPSWQVKGTGDFDGNAHADILLQNTNGQIAIWSMNGSSISQVSVVAKNPGSSWHVSGTADVNADGKTDITFKNDDGSVAVWEMNGGTILGGGFVSNPGTSWNLLGSGDMRFVASTGAGEVLAASPVVPEEFNMATAKAGSHTITGFNTTQDMIGLSAARFAAFSDVRAATTSTSGGAMINLGNSTSLLLTSVDLGSLHASNFAFV